MSDGISDGYKGAREYESFVQHLREILWWLQEPADKRWEDLTSSVGLARAQNIFGRLNDQEDLYVLLSKIRDKNKEVWAKLLFAVPRDQESLFQKLKKFSPFDGQIFVIVDYGVGFVHYYGEIDRLFGNAVNEKGWKTFDADKYAVVLPKDALPTDVIWVGGGLIGSNGPRPADK